MNSIHSENFIQDMIAEFNQRHPNHKDELKIIQNSETELTLSFHGLNHVVPLSDLYPESSSEDWTDYDLLWLNITNLFEQIVIIYERDRLEETLDILKETIKEKLMEISKKTDLDVNTLFVSFKESIYELESEF